MKTRFPAAPVAVLVLLLLESVIIGFSAFVFAHLDQVVHEDLYQHGLRFSYDWAGQYWTYSVWMDSFLTIALLGTVTSAILHLVYVRKGKINLIRYDCCFLLAIVIVANFLCVFFLTRLNGLVHTDLYKFGLQFSAEWTQKYWTYGNLMLSFLGLEIAVGFVSIVLFLKGAQLGLSVEGAKAFLAGKTPAAASSTPHMPAREVVVSEAEAELEELRRKVWSYRRLPTRLAGYAMTFVGASVLAGSMVFSSTVWAIVGLVLTFWGILFFFLKPTSLVKADLLDSASFSFLQNVDKLISEFGLKGKGVYLPPRSLKELRSGLVYISARDEAYVPTLAEVGEAEGKVFLKNPDGVCLVPSGVALVNLLEKELGTSFAGVGLEYLERNLPKVFVEALEIADDFELSEEDGRVHVRIEGSIYKDLCDEVRRLGGVCQVFGCPLCSSIAIALARASGKPVVMDENRLAQDGKAADVYYRVLEA